VDDLARQAEELASRQQDFEGQMRRTFGPAEQGCCHPQQAEQLPAERRRDSRI